MLIQGPSSAGSVATTAPAQATPAPGSSSLRFERDADLDFHSQADDVPPPLALALPAPGWMGFSLLCFLCLLAACTLVRPRLIRRIKGRGRLRRGASPGANARAPLAAGAPPTSAPAATPGQLMA